MKIIAKFSKTGDVRYCSHLDLQDLFMRAISRAKVPVAYSQGFNRHPNISMAMALGVGIESESEYLEVELKEKMLEDEFIQKMNCSLPKDVQIKGCKYVEGKSPALMSLVYCARYEIFLNNCTNLQEMSDEILNKSAIMIEKKTKTKNELTDIKPLILEFKVETSKITCMLRCGQVNLKPRDFARLFDDDDNFKILRTGIFHKNEDDTLVELMDINF